VPTVRSILGVPLHSVPDPAIPPGVVWAVSRDRVAVVLRQGADLVVSQEAFFTSDSVAIRATTEELLLELRGRNRSSPPCATVPASAPLLVP